MIIAVFWTANINNSLLLNWEVGQWASLLHLGCRGCEFESRPPNTFMVKLYLQQNLKQIQTNRNFVLNVGSIPTLPTIV